MTHPMVPPPRAAETFTVSGTWWCNSHGRAATHVTHNGARCCAPRLGGIMIPCFAVFAPMTVEYPKQP